MAGTLRHWHTKRLSLQSADWFRQSILFFGSYALWLVDFRCIFGLFITPHLKSTCLQPRYLGLYIRVGFGGLTF